MPAVVRFALAAPMRVAAGSFGAGCVHGWSWRKGDGAEGWRSVPAFMRASPRRRRARG